jgi:ParB/RepB/Spo0J family partition protein
VSANSSDKGSSVSNSASKKPGRFSGLTSKPAARQEAVFDKLAAGSGASRKMTQALIVSLEILRSNNYQIRQSYDENALQELASDIKERGILEPLVVREIEPGQYEIIAGERRYRAAKSAGLKEVPVVVHDMDDRQARLAMLVENIQRQDLNPTDEKRFFEQLQAEYNLSQTQIAKLVSKSVGYVSGRLQGKFSVKDSENLQNLSKLERLNNNSQSLSNDSIDNIPNFGQLNDAGQIQVKSERRSIEGKKITGERKFTVRTFEKVNRTLERALDYCQDEKTDEKALSQLKITVEEMKSKLAELEKALVKKEQSKK